MKYDTVNLPKSYSAADMALRDRHLSILRDLKRNYKRRAQPHIAALAEIESRYPPRVVLVPVQDDSAVEPTASPPEPS